MKKWNKGNRVKSGRRILAIVLCMMFVCTMFGGCGSKKDDTDGSSASGDTYAANLVLTLEGTVEYSCVSDDILFAAYYNWEDSDEPVYTLLTYDFNTGEQASAPIELETELEDFFISGLTVDSDKQMHVNVTAYTYEEYTDDSDGSGSTSITTSEEELTDDTIYVEDEEEYSYSYSSQTIELVYSSALELLSIEDGEIVTEGSLFEEEEYGEYTYTSVIDQDGNTITYGGSNSDGSEFVKAVDADGNEIGRMELEDWYWIDLFVLDDGTVLCAPYGDNGSELYELDVEKMEFGDKICDLGDLSGDLYAGSGQSLLFNNNGSFTMVDLTDGSVTELFKFLDVDLLADNVNQLFALSDGTLGCFLVDYNTDTTEIYTFEIVDPDSVTEKTEITLLTAYSDTGLDEQVVAFNKQNDEYKIVIETFADDWDDDTTWEDLVQNAYTQIISGDTPDIIDLSSLNTDQLAAKGALVDLISYIENDSDLSMDMFVQNVIEADMTGDALYRMPSYFTIRAFAGATSVVGEESGWTMQEFIDFANSLPEGTELLEDMTSDGLLYTILYACMDEYIDWSTGECNFDSDEFISLLEFCGQYMDSEEYYETYYSDDYDYDNEESEVTKIRNGKVVMQSMYMYDVSDYMLAKAIFGEDLTIKGYPTSEGSGIVIDNSGATLGISAKSEYQDVAWEFIKYYLENTSIDYWYANGFPVLTEKLDAMLDEINISNHEYDGEMTTWSFSDIDLEIPYPNDEEIAEIKEIIYAADLVEDGSEDIISLVIEEAEPYFEGQKTAAEVAEIIQSRISIYVKENS